MDEADFEGTEVLEKLATISAIDAFFAAVDADDERAALRLLRRAGVDEAAIATVLRKMSDGD